MTTQVTKEKIVRAVLELLPKVSAPAVDVGELVLFLEREADHWIKGRQVDLHPLWNYCRDKSGWQESFFRNLVESLQKRFAGTQVEWLSPFGEMDAASLADDFAEVVDQDSAKPAKAPSASQKQEEQITNWILDGIRRSPVERIIDPEKLRGFLSDALEEMQTPEGLELQMLWEVLLDAEGVDEQMLLKAFLIMQVEKNNQRLSWQAKWPSLVANLPEKIRQSMIESMGLEEKKVVEASEVYAIKSNRATGSQTTFGSASAAPKTGSGQRTVSPQERAKQARIQLGPIPTTKTTSGIPSWLLYTLLGVVAAAGIFYFVYLYKPAPSWTGQVINSTPYTQYLSFEAIRLKGRTINVKATQQFMKEPEARRAEKAYRMWNAIRREHRVSSMIIFSPDGQIAHQFEAR